MGDLLKEYFEEHLEHYVKEHAGEFIVLTEGDPVEESFYATEEEFRKVIKKYQGERFFTKRIPEKTHRFNFDRKIVEFRVDEHVTVCPNDNETMLEPAGPIVLSKNKYEEMARCPDCGYIVMRRPSDADIKRERRNLDDFIRKNFIK
ncbi:hypothetical protein KY342_01305 [Candidatus Woesearchaeota archaeon]|nr:hypothetical protein [Candidatus Woesearchaeota archaeon]